MLIITLDHNRNAILAQDEDDAVLYRRYGDVPQTVLAQLKGDRDLRAFGDVLEEILHRVNPRDVMLRRADEDQMTTIAEW